MGKLLLAIVLAATLFAFPALAQKVTPRPCDTTTVTTGSTAVTPIASVTTGYSIGNPVTATEQGVSPAESLFIDITGVAATILGVGTTLELLPGQVFPGVGASTTGVSINAASSGHKFSCTRW